MKEVLTTIYSYYPKGIASDDPYYSDSEQHRTLKALRDQGQGKSRDFAGRIESILPNYAVKDWTNLEDANCLQYKILLTPNQAILDDDTNLIHTLGGKRQDLQLYISILGYYFYCNVLETCYRDGGWTFINTSLAAPGAQSMYIKVQTWMKEQGYRELSHSECSSLVPDIETELLSFGEVRVFHALFTDMESL